jgi:hypothetical protein
MASPVLVQLVCPCCGSSFEDTFAAVLRLSGKGFHADLKPGYQSDSPLTERLLYQCPHCGFTERSILERFDGPLSQDLAAFYREILPAKREEMGLENGSGRIIESKFINYAFLQDYQNNRAIDIGKAFLRASWLDDSKTLLGMALEYFEKAITQTDVVGIIEAPLAAFLGGEVARRMEKNLTAERMFYLTETFSRKIPELSIRAYSHILHMAEQQSTKPQDGAVWNSASGLVLDPLDYFHANILMAAAQYYRYSQKENAFELYVRALEVCKPALDQLISQKVPQLSKNQPVSHFTRQMIELSLSNPAKGFWVDNCLIVKGYQSVNGILDLKSLIPNSEVLRKIEFDRKKYAEAMAGIEKDLQQQAKSTSGQAKRSTKGYTENRVVGFWNSVVFVFLFLFVSIAASAVTYFGLGLIQVEVNFIRLAFATFFNWIVWAFIQVMGTAIIRSIFKLFNKQILPQSPMVNFMGFIGFVIGVVSAYLIASWPLLVSVAVAGFLMLLSRKIVK